jgi:hypothetical protein
MATLGRSATGKKNSCHEYLIIQFLSRGYSMNLFCKIQSTNVLQKYSLFVMRLTCFHVTIGSLGPGSPRYRGFTITDTPHSTGLLWASYQPVAESCT